MHDSTLTLNTVMNDPDAPYKSPGVRQHAAPFLRALQQLSMYCHGSTFNAMDCVMLSGVIRNSSCSVKRLIFHDIQDGANANYEFDLLNAITKCRSIRSVYVLGGTYSANFLGGIINVIQTENPRIKELVMERVSCSNAAVGEEIGTAGGRLVCDYFNYSLPGLQSLSLHGCHLTDTDIDKIVLGMSVNSCVSSLCLSFNAITDEGFTLLFSSIAGNKKCVLNNLDLGWNLVNLKPATRAAVDLYFHHSAISVLEVNLQFNPVLDRYIPPASTRLRHELRVITGMGSSAWGRDTKMSVRSSAPVASRRPNSRGTDLSGGGFSGMTSRNQSPPQTPNTAMGAAPPSLLSFQMSAGISSRQRPRSESADSSNSSSSSSYAQATDGATLNAGTMSGASRNTKTLVSMKDLTDMLKAGGVPVQPAAVAVVAAQSPLFNKQQAQQLQLQVRYSKVSRPLPTSNGLPPNNS